MKKILFVCSYNLLRSKTAEDIYKESKEFEVKSCGTEKGATTEVNDELLGWADYIFVMENRHKEKILKNFGFDLRKKIKVMNIEDRYNYMDEELVRLIKEIIDKFFGKKVIDV